MFDISRARTFNLATPDSQYNPLHSVPQHWTNLQLLLLAIYSNTTRLNCAFRIIIKETVPSNVRFDGSR
jgi:hypothetical protein